MPDSPPADLDLDMSRFLLAQVGDQFCDLLEQEKEAISVHMSDGKQILLLVYFNDFVFKIFFLCIEIII